MSEFNRWLNRRNPRYFMEQERTPVPPAPAEDAFEAAKKRRAELKKIRDAAAGQPQPPMGQNPPAPVEDAFELAKKRRAELKRQRDDAAKQQPPTVQQPPMGQQPPTVQLPPQPSVGDFKDFINKPAAENKQGGTNQPPTMQPPQPPATPKPTQTEDEDDLTDDEIKESSFGNLYNHFHNIPEKQYSVFMKKIQQKGGLAKALENSWDVQWIAKVQKESKKIIITPEQAKELLLTRIDLDGITRRELKKILPNASNLDPTDNQLKKLMFADIFSEISTEEDPEKLYSILMRKITLENGLDGALKNNWDVYWVARMQLDSLKGRIIINPQKANELLKRKDLKLEIGDKTLLRRIVASGSSQQQSGM